MSRFAHPATYLLLMAALAAAGCTPSVGTEPASTTVPANTTVPIAGAAERPCRETSAAKPSPGKMPAAETTAPRMILVTNPAYNEDQPVLYDSGCEEDNSPCLVCHIDFEHELIAEKHLEAEVTCTACHGDSEVHRSDEYNIVRPDVIWGRAAIEPFCKQCHRKHKHPEKVDAFLQEWESKRRPNGRWVLRDSVCTDCHGKHAIVVEEGNFK